MYELDENEPLPVHGVSHWDSHGVPADVIDSAAYSDEAIDKIGICYGLFSICGTTRDDGGRWVYWASESVDDIYVQEMRKYYDISKEEWENGWKQRF